MAETNTRLDRIEKALESFAGDHEQFRQDHKQLLIAQVVQSDQIAENTRNIAALAQRIHKDYVDRKERDALLDKRVSDLVLAIGNLIARIPPTALA